MAAGAVYTRLYIEGNEYFMTLKKAQAQTQEWAKDTTKNVNTVGRDFANLARSVIGITAAFQTIKKTVSEGINFNKFVAEQTAAFGVMMKSTDAAKAKMQELYTFAVESPLTFKETVSASKQLLAYGFSAESLVKNMEMLGTVAKATGHSLDDISYVYGTLKTQGRAYSRDLMQFAMRGIPIYDELASVMGVTTQQIKKLTEQGAVGFEQVEKAFKNMTGEGGRFTGMMDAYMKTLSGQLSMLGDIAQQSAGKLASGITSAMTGGLGGIMDALGDYGGTLTNIGTDLGMIASALISIAEAAIRLAPAIVLIVKTLIAGKILKMMTSLPGLLVKAGLGITNMAVGLQTLNASFLAMGAASTMAFTSIGTSISWLSAQLLTLMANPVFLTLAAVVGGAAVLATAMSRASAAEATLRETNPKEALRQTVIGNMQGSFAADPTGMAASGISYTASQVKAAAKEFNLSLSDTAKILQDLGVVTTDVYSEIQNAISKGEDKLIQAAQRAMKSRWEIEAQWYATFAGGSASKYTNMVSKESKGVLAATDYIATFEADRQTMKDALGYVYGKDDLKDALTDEMNALRQKLIEGADVIQYEDEYDASGRLLSKGSQFDDILRARIKEIEDIIAEGSEKVKEVEKDLWFTREWQAKASESKIDDLTLERDKAQATAEKKYLVDKSITEEEYYTSSLAINEWYWDEREKLEKERLDKLYIKLSEGDPEFFANMRRNAASSFESGDVGLGLAQAGGASMLEGTEMGSMVAGANPLLMIILKFVELAKEIESVNKVLNPITTVLESAFKIIGPILDVAFSGLASVLEEFGGVIGDILAPVMGVLATVLQMAAGILKITVVPVLQLLGSAFAWFYDGVIVPVGNAIIKAINGVIKLINKLPGVNIALLRLLETTEMIAKMAERLDEAMRSLENTISYLQDKLNTMIDTQIASMQDLYEVGAISATQYQTMVDDTNQYRIDTDLELVSLADQQLSTMESIYNRILELLALQEKLDSDDMTDLEKLEELAAHDITPDASTLPTQAELDAAEKAAKFAELMESLKGTNLSGMWNTFHFADGTPNIPNDMMAKVHKGETIVPQTFAEGIRSGEMVLSGTDEVGSGGSPVYVTVNVEGSVSAENDLATSVAQAIYTQRKRGLLTV